MNNYVVDFPVLNSKVYIRPRVWGLTGDSEETRIQSSPIDNATKCSFGDCLIIFASEIYYRQEGVDALHIYAISSAVPKEYTDTLGSIKIKITELDTYEELRNYAAKQALLKASVLEEK